MSTEETDDTIEETDTELEFRELHADAITQAGRLKQLADKTEAASPDVAGVLREMSGTVLSLVVDLVAACGGTFRSVEERLDDLEPAIRSAADIVMLDNMSPARMRKAVSLATGRCAR